MWFVVLLLALVVRLGWGLSRPADDISIEALPDQREYLQLGRNLLGRDSLEFVDPRFKQTVYAFRMPGYPIFVAACGGDVRVIRTLQALLDTSTAGAAGLLAVSLFGGEGAGIAAVVLVAINPFLIYFSGLLLSDTLYTAVFIWAIVLLQRRRIIFGALLLSLGVLIRPSGLLLAIILPAVAALASVRSLRAAVRTAAISGVLLAVMLMPWAVRNHRVLHHWVITTTNTGFTLYDGFHDGATGASDQRFVQTMPELQTADEVDRSRLLERRATDWIETNPLQVLWLAGAKLFRFWSPIPLSAEFGRRSYVIAGGVYALVDVFAVTALWVRRRNLTPFAIVLAAFVAFSAIHAMSVGSLRYRLPLEPVIATLAGGSLATRRFLVRLA